MYYGIPKGPDFQSLAAPVEDEEEAEGDSPDKKAMIKKKKAKRDPLFSKKTKSDPNAPPPDRIPVPELYDKNNFFIASITFITTLKIIFQKR